MRLRLAAGVVGRMLGTYLASALLMLQWPEPWLRCVAPVVSLVSGATSPYLETVRMTAEGIVITVRGQVHLRMTMADGTPLPAVPGVWHRHGGLTINMLMISAALWAAPPIGWRRRSMAFPVMLLAAILAASVDLATEVQVTALRVIGSEWLPGIPMLPTDANKAYVQELEHALHNLQWIKAFNDAGGRLFLAVLAGLLGYVGPRPSRRL